MQHEKKIMEVFRACLTAMLLIFGIACAIIIHKYSTSRIEWFFMSFPIFLLYQPFIYYLDKIKNAKRKNY